MNSILSKIAAHKQNEVKQLRIQKPLSELKRFDIIKSRDFIKAIHEKKPAVIAEIKKASPSKGILRRNFNVAEIANSYERHGACCLSVLTDVHFFKGHPTYIANAKAHCNLPILRKDFIIDEYQVYESKALGADCILLIVAILDDAQLNDYCTLAHELGMAVLVESHSHEELQRALNLPTPLMGINNRSLHTFQTDIQCSLDLKQYVPDDKVIISESGIHTKEDIQLMQDHNIHTFLIGESLMRASSPGQQLKKLLTKP